MTPIPDARLAELIDSLEVDELGKDSDTAVALRELQQHRAGAARDAQDARRYRWLRSADVDDLNPLMEGSDCDGRYLMGDLSLDAAIDAALSRGEP